MATIIKISGMHCDNCARKVKAVLESVPGITPLDVKVGEAVVDGAVDITKITAVIEGIEGKGFKVVSAN